MSRPEFGRGVHPVLSMPFDEHEDVDEATLLHELDWLVGHGVDGVVLAMVSELLRLDEAERRSVGRLLVDAAGRRVPVVLSVGAETTRAAVAYAVHAEAVGASAVMAVPPVTVSLPDGEILAYFTAIAAAVDIPLVVQDASGYVGRPLPLDLYRALLEEFGPDRVRFKPEAVPIGPRLTALQELSGGSAQVFEGTGGLSLVDSHARGIVGTMPGAEVPWALVALWRALEAGDLDRADAVHWPLAALVTLQTSLDSFVATEKHLLVRQGVFGSARRRRPCGPDLDPATRAEVDRLFDRLQATVGGF